MELDLTYHEQIHPFSPAGERSKAGLLPGLTALTIIGAAGLLSVIPAKAAIYPGFGWVEVSGTVGAQADNLRADTCNLGAAMVQGLSPVCSMPLN